jgi:hypothetical protein
MNNRKQISDIDGLFHLINRMSAEADWDEEELRHEIKASGVDPERLVSSVKARLDEMLTRGNPDILKEAKHFPLPLLSELKRLSKLSASEIARRLGVPLAFLSAVERHPEVIPSSWRDELAARGERGLQISKDALGAVLEIPLSLEVATFNNRLSGQITYEDILEMSDMDESGKLFWLELARSA